MADLRKAEIRLPDDQEGTTAKLVCWLRSIGDAVAEGEALAEVETDKVTMEITATHSGELEEQCVAAGEDLQPGALLGRIRLGAAAPERDERTGTEAAPALSTASSFAPELRLSPSVRRVLAETGLGPEGVVGTGRGSRITREDVTRAAAEQDKPVPVPVSSTDIAVSPETADKPASEGGVRRLPHDRMRLRIAERTATSLSTAPHVTAVFEADFSAVIAHRAAKRNEFERQGIALTYTVYMVAAAVQAMAAAPTVNSRWHDDHLEVLTDVNVGVGTALGDKGLIVPVVHRAQTLSLVEIAKRLGDAVERARNGRLAPADVQGGTFSISNHGVSGSLMAAPIIINQPQSAILGVGKLEKRVVVRGAGGVDTLQIRPMAYVTLTIDHRVLDGASTNAWLSRFTQTIESWPSD